LYQNTGKDHLIDHWAFPNQLFIVVIYEEDLETSVIRQLNSLKGKNLCVTGDVVMYISGPEIIVEREDQIQVME
jgi:hypothetical protein